ncbi:MAG: DUF3793 family protein [Peptococcaceae bacterium]|nr:DUF3793 family protein [Peptococcaceae bacterium]
MNKKIMQRYLEFTNKLDDYNYLLLRIAFRTAPTLLGIKPACLISLVNPSRNIIANWEQSKSDITGRLDLDYLEIKKSSQKILILFYREEILAKYLALKENQDFLKQLGYREGLNNMLSLVQARFKSGCPHEIGLFLGFPCQDVKAFMEYQEKISGIRSGLQVGQGPRVLLNGYWKVYHKPDLASDIFRRYDLARMMVMIVMLDPLLVLKVFAYPPAAEP